MFLVVISHYAVHSGFNFGENSPSINRYYTLFTILGNAGVNTFVLISSYFLSDSAVRGKAGNSTGILSRYKKLFPMWRSMFLYSAILLPVLIKTGFVEFNKEDLIHSFFPVIYEKWWFATTYIILFLLHPFLNMFIERIDNRNHLRITAIVTVVWILIPTLTEQKLKCNDVVWFICLYLIASFINRNIESFKGSSFRYIALSIAFFFAYCVSVVAIELLKKTIWPSFKSFNFRFSDKQSMIMVLLSIFLFLGFIKMKEHYSKVINALAGCTFGIYLLSENPHMRRIIWTSWNPGLKYVDRRLFIPISLGYCIAVFCVCCLIEFIRIHTVEYVASRLFKPLEERIVNFIRFVFSKINNAFAHSSDKV